MNDNHKYIPFTERELKELEAQSDGRSIAQMMRDHNYPVHKAGSFNEVIGEDGRAYVPDSARAMAKPDRALVLRVLKAIIVIGLIIIAFHFQAEIRSLLIASGWL